MSVQEDIVKSAIDTCTGESVINLFTHFAVVYTQKNMFCQWRRTGITEGSQLEAVKVSRAPRARICVRIQF